MATREQLIEDFADHKYATGEKFERLINSMKVVQLPVVDPQALGTSLSFIDSISQDEDGKITATKKTLDLANANELNPFKGWYKTGDTLPTDGFDGAYLYFKDTSELTGQTTIYRWNGTTYADTGTVVDTSNVQTLGSGQAVNEVKIKDENGEEVTGTADVLSAEAGKNIGDAVFGEKNKVTTIIQPTSVTTAAYITKSTSEGEGNVQINHIVSSFPDMRTAFYPIAQGRKYTIYIPVTGNQYMGVYAYTNNVAPEPITGDSYILSGYHFSNVGDGSSQQVVIGSAMSYTYLAVTYSTANDAGAPTVTEEYETIGSPGLNEKVETLQEDAEALVEDVDETIYENEGQVDYYDENEITTKWAGTGTSTPALSSDAIINKVIFPPFKNITAGNYTCKYLVGYRVYSASFTTIPRTNLTILAEGSIENVSNSFIRNFYIELESPATIPAGNQLIVLLYIPNGKACILGGGNNATEVLPYNSEDAVALLTTSVTDTPFDVTWSKAQTDNTARYKVCNPILRFEKKSEVRRIAEEAVEEVVPNLVDERILENGKVNIYLPNKFYAVVGDTLQLFFQSIVGVINIADYDIYAECSVGKTFPRYFFYTPTVEDVGTTTLTIYVKDRNNNILGQASCDIVTVSAPTSPASEKSIFTFGDSLTSGGQWAGEAKRRLVGNTTYDSITGKGLSNISFFGYKNKTINGQSVDYFGVGGWTWLNYLSKATIGAFRFYVEGVNQLHLGATYTNNGHTYTIQEINVTGDSGNIRCTTSSTTNTPSASGTLTKTSGDGDTTITFGSFDTENANPLWDDANNKMSFVPYVQDCGASTIDAVYVLLSWNGQSAWKEYSASDISGHINNAKIFARKLHDEYPSAKLFIMGIQMPSDTGGLGANYGASGGYIDGYGLKQCALNYNKALQDLCNLDEFSPYCEFVAVAPQFDSHYNMPYYNTNVNTRSTVKEMLGSNGVHPSDGGYFQIADAVYRSIVANFCQGV